jgi:hypothetical protein
MGNNLPRQLIADHLFEGDMRPGEEIALKIDQFLLRDGTGPLCALQLEAMGVGRISGDTAVAYLRPSPRLIFELSRREALAPTKRARTLFGAATI